MLRVTFQESLRYVSPCSTRLPHQPGSRLFQSAKINSQLSFNVTHEARKQGREGEERLFGSGQPEGESRFMPDGVSGGSSIKEQEQKSEHVARFSLSTLSTLAISSRVTHILRPDSLSKQTKSGIIVTSLYKVLVRVDLAFASAGIRASKQAAGIHD